MTVTLLQLVANEIRMSYNQVRRTASEKSMLVFYLIVISAGIFISYVISLLVAFSPLITDIQVALEELLDRNLLFTAASLLPVASLLSGYFGEQISSYIQSTDEQVLMPAPVKTYQIFVSNYVRQLLRKAAYLAIVILVLFPVIQQNIGILPALGMLLVSSILYLDSNYFIHSIAAEISADSSRIKRIGGALVLAAIILIPTIPQITSNPNSVLLLHSNAYIGIITETTGILSIGYFAPVVFATLFMFYMIWGLTATILNETPRGDAWGGGVGQATGFSEVVKGEANFVNSRLDDPITWIMKKDFWSRIRLPLQFWKYIYAVVGGSFVVYLFLVTPSWLQPIQIPQQFQSTAVPAFMLILILLVQVSCISSLMSFMDEKERVYLLKSSPLRTIDIVLSKYIQSVLESCIGLLPQLGLLVYIFRVEGSAFLTSLAFPLVLVFSAAGIMMGSYVPVFTNNPSKPPIPLALAFPVVDLVLGGMMMTLVLQSAEAWTIQIIMPMVTVLLVGFFLRLSVQALDNYK
ncbi:MAG: hypothetical protein KGY80_06075 [Candidatus Thorarchaeota archaeon]|nr:hypothetical protein [Candidatus Thorarchaeota archaeon]